MEIYTGDFITFAEETANKIELNKGNDYIIIDECCNLKQRLCSTIYERLTEQFKQIIDNQHDDNFDLEKELFKTINEL